MWSGFRGCGSRSPSSRTAFVNALLTDWTVSGVHNWSSGNPLNFTMGTDVALDGTGGAGRQLAQLAPGKTVDDISRDQSSQRRLRRRVFRHHRVCAGEPVAAARYLRQRAEERHQRAGDGEDATFAVVADLRGPGSDGNAAPVPRASCSTRSTRSTSIVPHNRRPQRPVTASARRTWRRGQMRHQRIGQIAD